MVTDYKLVCLVGCVKKTLMKKRLPKSIKPTISSLMKSINVFLTQRTYSLLLFLVKSEVKARDQFLIKSAGTLMKIGIVKCSWHDKVLK